MVDEKESSKLDPQLWQELPRELLERVIAKLPFFRVVALRSVCKFWYSDIIPSVVPHVQRSSKAALLYVDSKCARGEFQAFAWWLKVSNPNSVLQKFQQPTFPSPRLDEDVRLMDSQQGLLFFGFRDRTSWMVREIVVCNPLTSKCKSLGLPYPMRSPLERPGFSAWRRHTDLLIGVVFEGQALSYCLVVAGMDETDRHLTLLYDSSTSTWRNGMSVLPTFQEAGVDHHRLKAGHTVYCNGDLHWLLLMNPSMSNNRQYVLRFNLQMDKWSIDVVHLEPGCRGFRQQGLWRSQMVSHEGELFLWHLEAFTPWKQLVTKETVELLKRELFDPNYVSRYPSSMVCSCDLGLIGAPIKLMQHTMPHYIERIDGFFSLCMGLHNRCEDYTAFSHQNLIYHIFATLSNTARILSLRIIVHDTNENSFTELPVLQSDRIPGFDISRVSVYNIWSFSASLTAVP